MVLLKAELRKMLKRKTRQLEAERKIEKGKFKAVLKHIWLELFPPTPIKQPAVSRETD